MSPLLAPPIYARWDDNIVRAATVTCDETPLTGYALQTLVTGEPFERVLFDTDTLELTFTIGSPARGDVLVIPCSNLQDESEGVLRLTNAAGLSVDIPVPVMPVDGIPTTLACDVSLLEANETVRTSNIWHLEIANGADLTFGGGISIYRKRTLPEHIEWGLTLRLTAGVTETPNEYLARYRAEHETLEQSLDCVALTEDLTEFTAWFRAQRGRSRPGLLWPQFTGFDPYYGTWQRTFEAVQMRGAEAYQVRIVFDELTKGKPVT